MTSTVSHTSNLTGLSRAGRAVKSGSLKGTFKLLWFMLRRDRIRFPAWGIGMAAMLGYFSTALGVVLDQQSLESFAAFAKNPMMALIGGPGYGFDNMTVPIFIVGLYGAYLMLGAALMSILTISRHTRVEEQTGRAELVRANVVGRHARLAAALILTTLMNVLVSVLMAVVFYTSPSDPGFFLPCLLFGASVGAVGLVFMGVEAVAVQLTPTSRMASAIAGLVLAITFMIRGLGDMSEVSGGSLGWLSWLSPLGWSQQTAPFTLDRWWPLGLSVITTVVLIAVAFSLQSHRDLGAGILPDRLGRANAASWIRTPFALALRLQRSTLIGWALATLFSGIVFGAFANSLTENADGMPAPITTLFGGKDAMTKGYLGYMGIYMAIIIAVYVILSIQSLRSEEQDMRTEPVLATAVSRQSWLLSWVGIAAVGAAVLLLLGGVGLGIGACMFIGDWSLLGSVTLGVLVHSADLWVLLGLSVLLYGFAPRLLGLVWAVYVWSTLIAFFGPIVTTDKAVLDSSIFNHVGSYPASDISWISVGVLTLIAAVLIVAGDFGFKRRDLITA